MKALASGLCLAIAAASAAAAPAPAPPCDTISFTATPAQSLHVARVRPGPHATFLAGRDTCPNLTPACREASYVIPGDQLLTAITQGPYTCAYYSNGRTETAGWLPTLQIERLREPAPRPATWLGTWHYGDSTLAIRQVGPNLAVAAQAFWPSKSDPDGHVGSLDAEARPDAARLSLADPDDPQGCKLTLTLVGPDIVAHDNNACGGANVSLSGIYRK